MSLYSVKSMLIVVLLAVAARIAVDGFKFPDSLERVVEKAKEELKDHLPADLVKKWTRLIPAVKHMAVDLPLTEILPQQKKQTVQASPKVRDIGFTWQSCGPADQLVEIRNLTISPSPLFFPGPLTFGFDILFHDSIPQDAQVSADMLLEYSARSQSWVKIPCIGQLGSCTYQDVCFMSRAIVCPDELTKRGIPCTCPIAKGEYVLPGFEVDVLASVFLSGDYRATVTFKDSAKGQIACYKVTFTVG